MKFMLIMLFYACFYELLDRVLGLQEQKTRETKNIRDNVDNEIKKAHML